MRLGHRKREAQQQAQQDSQSIAGRFDLRDTLGVVATAEVETEIHTRQETEEKDEEKIPRMVNEPEQGVPVLLEGNLVRRSAIESPRKIPQILERQRASKAVNLPFHAFHGN
jgi:hypothetical protein